MIRPRPWACRFRIAATARRSQFETAVRERYKTATPLSSWTMTPLQDAYGIVTPSGLHFERSHAGTAVIDPARHSLYVHGMVREPRKYAMRDLRRFPSLSRTAVHRMLGQHADRMVEADDADRAGHARPHLDLGMDRRAARDDPARGRRSQPGAKWLLAEGARRRPR